MDGTGNGKSIAGRDWRCQTHEGTAYLCFSSGPLNAGAEYVDEGFYSNRAGSAAYNYGFKAGRRCYKNSKKNSLTKFEHIKDRNGNELLSNKLHYLGEMGIFKGELIAAGGVGK